MRPWTRTTEDHVSGAPSTSMPELRAGGAASSCPPAAPPGRCQAPAVKFYRALVNIGIRREPDVGSDRTGAVVTAGDVFEVTEEVQGDGGQRYLKLKNEDGWVFAHGVVGELLGKPIVQAEETGDYTTTNLAAVTETVAMDSRGMGHVEVGTRVHVVEVVKLPEEQRLRGRLEDPAGWISLLNTENGFRWAEQADAEEQGLAELKRLARKLGAPEGEAGAEEQHMMLEQQHHPIGTRPQKSEPSLEPKPAPQPQAREVPAVLEAGGKPHSPLQQGSGAALAATAGPQPRAPQQAWPTGAAPLSDALPIQAASAPSRGHTAEPLPGGPPVQAGSTPSSVPKGRAVEQTVIETGYKPGPGVSRIRVLSACLLFLLLVGVICFAAGSCVKAIVPVAGLVVTLVGSVGVLALRQRCQPTEGVSMLQAPLVANQP